MIIAGLNCQITVTVESWPCPFFGPEPPQFSWLDVKVLLCLPEQGNTFNWNFSLFEGRRNCVRGYVRGTEWSCAWSPWQLHYERLLEQMDKWCASCVFSHQVCVYMMLWICMCVSRYNELLFIIDTCQGASMYDRFYSPNLMALASSQVGEDSLSVSYPCTYKRVELKIHLFVRLSNKLCGLTARWSWRQSSLHTY